MLLERPWESGDWWLRSEGEGVFSRLEDKYLVPAEAAPALLNVLASRLRPDYPKPGIAYTLVESCYFDSPGFEFLVDHFSEKERRVKVRLRRYGPNGAWETDAVLLEIKAKLGEISQKIRIRIDGEDALRLTRGEMPVWSDELARLNPKLARGELEERLGAVRGLFDHYHLEPTCIVRYRRVAFSDGSLRVTLDQGIEAEVMRPIGGEVLGDVAKRPGWPALAAKVEQFIKYAPSVLETKHAGSVAAWLTAYLRASGIGEGGFSKYCCSMAAAAMRQP